MGKCCKQKVCRGPRGFNGHTGAQGPTGSSSFILNSFVFRPGGVESDNVFTDWNELISAHSLVEGPTIIELDDRFGAIIIPAGGPYDMRDTVIQGRYLSGVPVVATISPGVTFENLEWLKWCRFNYSHSSPAMVVPTGLSYFRMWGGSIQNNGIGPFFDASSPGTAFLTQFENASGFNPFDGTPVVDLGSSGVLSFSLDEACTNGTGTVSGSAGSTVITSVRDPSARVEDIASPAFTGFAAPPTLVSISSNISYVDQTPPLTWAAPSPSTVQNAIDRLAVAVSGLLGGSIP